MAPSLTLNLPLPLEDYWLLLAVPLGSTALAIVLRNWGRTRPADPEAIELEETGAAARRTTTSEAQRAVLGGTPLPAVDTSVAVEVAFDALDNSVASVTTLNPIDDAVATPLGSVDDAVAGDVVLNAIVNVVASFLPAAGNAIAGDTTLDAIDNAVATPLPAVAGYTRLDAIATPSPLWLRSDEDNVSYNINNSVENIEVRGRAMLRAADDVASA